MGGRAFDFLHEAAGIGQESLAQRAIRSGGGRVTFPRAAVGATRHVGQGIETILRAQRHFVHRAVGGGAAFAGEDAVRVHVAIRRGIHRGGRGLGGMGAERFYIYRDRGGETLEMQRVGNERAAKPVQGGRKIVPRARLAAGDRRVLVEDRRGGASHDRHQRESRGGNRVRGG